jgi:Ion channel
MSAADSASGADAAEAAEGRLLRERFGLLFLALVVVFFVEGIASEGALKDATITFLVSVALAISFQAADMPRRRLRRFILLVALVMAAVIVAQVTGHDRVVTGVTRLANGMLVALAPIAVVIGVQRSLRRRQAVTIEVVLGALCFYLLVGLFFAFLYGAINDLGGNPFYASKAASTSAHNVYFSFTTLTTTGFGDLTARSNLGHTLSNLEMLVGQIYLVTVVSVVVGNLRPRRGRMSGSES